MLERRDFLKFSALSTVVAGTGITIPFAPAWAARWDRTLILLELKGGNDGLNTIVPFTDQAYYDVRPTLAVARDKVLKVDGKLGFNPAWNTLMPLWSNKQMAAVMGLGYPNPNLSHFRGIDIWNTASDADELLDIGWISRLFETAPPGSGYAADGVNLGYNELGPLNGGNTRSISLQKRPERILKQASRLYPGRAAGVNDMMAHIIKQRRDLRSAAENIIAKQIEAVQVQGHFPETALGEQFRTAARLLIAGVKVPVLKLSIAKFDTHAQQEPLHGALLADVGGSIAAFAAEMEKQGFWNNVLVMTFSEFGRRVKENISAGTDHGTAAPQFLFGGRVSGGFYGEHPPLDDLENGNLKHRLHFRSLYATVTEEWWGLQPDFLRAKPLGIIT